MALPFGGKLMLLGGDWKQLTPVIPQCFTESIFDYTIKTSPLWRKFKVRTSISLFTFPEAEADKEHESG